MDEEACKKTLTSLSTPKIKILMRQAAGASAVTQADGDAKMIDTTVVASQVSTDNEAGQGSSSILDTRFHLNLNFRSNQFRLNLPIPAIEDEGTQTKKTKIVKDRAHAVDATIVKRMKTNKRMDYKDLMTEVLQALSMFQPQPHFVKQRIEKLVEDEFLARDADDRSILVYMP